MYRPDPGGHFDSDAHRVVLAHLSVPEDPYGYTAATLHARIGPVFGSDGEVADVLTDLEASELAEDTGGGVYRMTTLGFGLLNGPIKDEPPLDAPVEGPAMITTSLPQPYLNPPTSSAPTAPTPIGE